MEREKHIRHLLEKYIHDTLSPEEHRELLEYFGKKEHEQVSKQLLYESFISDEIKQSGSDFQLRKVMDSAYERIERRMGKPKHSLLRRILPYAAAVMAIIAISIYTYERYAPAVQSELVSAYGDEVLPGSNRATLIIDGWKSFPLSENKNGIKVTEDQIFYSDGTTVTQKGTVQYATLETPRKGQYHIVLPDGTKVWVNAESSLRYPTAFKSGNRIVELKGEAYFEVTHDPQHPFIVKSSTQQVKVLGTAFNINAYDNEPQKITTLVNGKIELKNTLKTDKKILASGQQSILGAYAFTTRTVDPSLYTAWKDGKFRFKGASIEEVLRQLERWYDIDINYTGIPNNVKISASIKRDKKLSSVLSAIEEISGVKFKVEGRRLLLMD